MNLIPTGLEALQSAYRAAPESKIFAPLADAYRRAGRLDEAVQVLEQGTARHPDYVAALVLLALCQLDLGRTGAAEASLARVLALDPENLVALKRRARRCLDRGDLSQVTTLLELVTGIDPYDREAMQLRDELRARRDAATAAPAATTAAPEPVTPPGAFGPPRRSVSTPVPGVPPGEMRPSAAEAPVEPPPAPTMPSPPTSDAEWDVQRDADRIVIRPRAVPEAPPVDAPAAVPSAAADEFSTLTLARIYESQGYVDKAIAIYEDLLHQQPGNRDIAARLAALRQRPAVESPPANAPPTTPAGDTTRQAAAPQWRLLDAQTLTAPPAQTAEQLRELADSVRERERGRHHTQIGRAPEAPPPAPDAGTTARDEEPDFERFLRYVRSLKPSR